MSVISHKHKFIYIAVPRTASTSTQRLWFMPEAFSPGHDSITEFPKEKREEYFVWCGVRNPYARIFSHFAKHCRDGVAEVDWFPEWIKHAKRRPSKGISLMDPQTDYILDENGKVAVDFMARQENLYEDIQKAMDKIGIDKKLEKEEEVDGEDYDQYGVSSSLQRNNAAGYFVDNKNLFTKQAIKRINEVYKRDFELLPYEMKTFEGEEG